MSILSLSKEIKVIWISIYLDKGKADFLIINIDDNFFFQTKAGLNDDFLNLVVLSVILSKV